MSILCLGCQQHRPGAPCTPLAAALGPSFTFDSIGALAEFAGGERAVVVDGLEGDVHLVHWASGLNRTVVHRGAGPLEVRSPSALLRDSDSTVQLFDYLSRRFIAIGSDGAVRSGRAWAPGAAVSLAAIVQATPFAIDSVGRVYGIAQADWRRDSIHVLRCTAASQCDTAITVPAMLLHPPPPKPSGRQNQVGVRPVRGAVVVDASGRILLVSASDLAVYARTQHDAWARIATLPMERIPITREEWDRIAAVDSTLVMRGVNASMRALIRNGVSLTDVPLEERSVVRAAVPPKWYPPFGPTSPVLSPEGDLFITRGHADGARHRVTVVQRDAVHCLEMPAGTRLVSVGARYVYAATRLEDGVELLRRHERPRF